MLQETSGSHMRQLACLVTVTAVSLSHGGVGSQGHRDLQQPATTPHQSCNSTGPCDSQHARSVKAHA